MTPQTGDEAFAHCEKQVREADRDRYLSFLLAGGPDRRRLFALAAFDIEARQIASRVREPMAGEIRLQWWRDAIAGSSATGNPVADALRATIADAALPLDPFQRYLEARIFDLYADPMPSVTALEGYAGETAAAMIQLSVLIIDAAAGPAAAVAAGHAGVAATIAAILGRIGTDASRGMSWVPPEIRGAAGLPALEGEGVDDIGAKARAVAAMAALGLEHVGKANDALSALPQSIMPAFAHVAVSSAVLRRIAARPGSALANKDLTPSPLLAQWKIWRASRRRKI